MKLKYIAYHLPLFLNGNISAHNNFFLSKLKPKPKAVEINITEKCCLKCIMCNIWRKRSNDELSLKEVTSILDQLKENGFTTVSFAGGEPLLRPDIFDIIRYANKLDFNVHLLTNGYLVNEDVAIKLIENGVSSVSLSLDTTGKRFDDIRGVKGAYQNVYNAIKIFTALKKEKKLRSFTISTTLMKPTINTVHEVINLGKEMEVPVRFNLLDYTPYFFQNVALQKDQLWIGEEDIPRLNKLIDELIEIKRKHPLVIADSYASLEYIRNYFQDTIRKDIPCFKILKNIRINPQGKVYPCWSVPSVGDLRNEKLSYILKSEKYIKTTQKLFKKNCPGCTCSYETDLTYNIPSLIEEMKLRAQFWRK